MSFLPYTICHKGECLSLLGKKSTGFVIDCSLVGFLDFPCPRSAIYGLTMNVSENP